MAAAQRVDACSRPVASRTPLRHSTAPYARTTLLRSPTSLTPPHSRRVDGSPFTPATRARHGHWRTTPSRHCNTGRSRCGDMSPPSWCSMHSPAASPAAHAGVSPSSGVSTAFRCCHCSCWTPPTPSLLVRIALAAGDDDLAESAISAAQRRLHLTPDVSSLAATAAHARGLWTRDPSMLAEATSGSEAGTARCHEPRRTRTTALPSYGTVTGRVESQSSTRRCGSTRTQVQRGTRRACGVAFATSVCVLGW